MSLSPKQQRFVEEFLIDANATGAAVRAGYAQRSAHVAGCRLLRVDKVAAAVQARRAAISQELSKTREEVVARLLEAIDMARVQGT